MGYIPPAPPPSGYYPPPSDPCGACGGDGLVYPGDYLEERRPDMPPRRCHLCGGRVRSGVRPQPVRGERSSLPPLSPSYYKK